MRPFRIFARNLFGDMVACGFSWNLKRAKELYWRYKVNDQCVRLVDANGRDWIPANTPRGGDWL